VVLIKEQEEEEETFQEKEIKRGVHNISTRSKSIRDLRDCEIHTKRYKILALGRKENLPLSCVLLPNSTAKGGEEIISPFAMRFVYAATKGRFIATIDRD
jgi:hypothetical protein